MVALFPLYNSLRIAFFSTIIAFFTGIFAAYYITKLKKIAKGIADVILTLPLVLPPTVVGYLLLKVLGPRTALGKFAMLFDIQLTMTWYGAVFACELVAFPLIYRTARGAFESFPEDIAYAAQTLGLSNWYIFFKIRLPACKQSILAGVVLGFARAVGEYGATSMVAGYTPNRTATIATTVYQLWRTGNETEAFYWVIVNVIISFIVMTAVVFFEKSDYINKKDRNVKANEH